MTQLIFNSKRILSEEYQQIAIWYFVAFFFGIIYHFSIQQKLLIAITVASCILVIILLLTLYYTINKESIFIVFINGCLLGFVLGNITAKIKTKITNVKPINRTIISNIIGNISEIMMTENNYFLLLNDVLISHKKYYGNKLINKLKISLPRDYDIDLQHGDRISLKAKIFTTNKLKTHLNPSYDQEFFNNLNSIEGTAKALSKISVISRNKPRYNLNYYIHYIQSNIEKKILNVMHHDTASVLSAIIIGNTTNIRENIMQDIRNSGVAHILCVSGLHISAVTLTVFFITRLLLNLSNTISYSYNIKAIALVVALIFSFVYLIIINFKIAATRAFIMNLILIISKFFSKQAISIRNVMFTASCMLIFYPEYIFHPSFQLSFIAVLSLISGNQILNKKLITQNTHYKIGIFYSLRNYLYVIIYTTLLASLGTSIFVGYHFYKIPSYGIISNLIIVPITSFLIIPISILALLMMLIGYEYIPLILLDYIIYYFYQIAHYIAELPKSVIYTGNIQKHALLLFAIIFFWLIIWKTNIKILAIAFIPILGLVLLKQVKPVCIYSHFLNAIGIVNAKKELTIYTDNIDHKVIENWYHWYGQSEYLFDKKKLSDNQIFITKFNKKIALNITKCFSPEDADVQIITSNKLKCNTFNNQLNITHDMIKQFKEIIIYCNSEFCYLK
ncbi:ComEC/Rec2 family competence protein [Rickettsia endosymbiont of Cardiosporidium cionae]|uniref:ComEC/Rec2 family competence protein n=1 Tax=Rickettsia endosymbiont of Cardiosporidium cionae TaxID=2777155 RepID=UPI001894923D|nr:ComEC/Rec2 family competence protein [Rickettsia endosymbiont of Cardiosporidium cionae]KAF8818810.1 hypothetical protein IHI24_000044 [Rickettsia endosymbiont of Cardiosporidium cionae]